MPYVTEIQVVFRMDFNLQAASLGDIFDAYMLEHHPKSVGQRPELGPVIMLFAILQVIQMRASASNSAFLQCRQSEDASTNLHLTKFKFLS